MRLHIIQPDPAAMDRVLLLDEVDTARAFSCAHYDDCVATAAADAWTSFHCGRCEMRPAGIVEPGNVPVAPPVVSRLPWCAEHGATQRAWELFAEVDTWRVVELAAELGIHRRQARDACRTLEAKDRIKRIAPGIYERVA